MITVTLPTWLYYSMSLAFAIGATSLAFWIIHKIEK